MLYVLYKIGQDILSNFLPFTASFALAVTPLPPGCGRAAARPASIKTSPLVVLILNLFGMFDLRCQYVEKKKKKEKKKEYDLKMNECRRRPELPRPLQVLS